MKAGSLQWEQFFPVRIELQGVPCKPYRVWVCSVRCKCLQGFMGVSVGFPLQYLWIRDVRITEKPYTPQKERLCMLWGNPVIFTLWFLQSFSIEKTYRHLANPCKHLQCKVTCLNWPEVKSRVLILRVTSSNKLLRELMFWICRRNNSSLIGQCAGHVTRFL